MPWRKNISISVHFFYSAVITAYKRQPRNLPMVAQHGQHVVEEINVPHLFVDKCPSNKRRKKLLVQATRCSWNLPWTFLSALRFFGPCQKMFGALRLHHALIASCQLLSKWKFQLFYFWGPNYLNNFLTIRSESPSQQSLQLPWLLGSWGKNHIAIPSAHHPPMQVATPPWQLCKIQVLLQPGHSCRMSRPKE